MTEKHAPPAGQWADDNHPMQKHLDRSFERIVSGEAAKSHARAEPMSVEALKREPNLLAAAQQLHEEIKIQAFADRAAEQKASDIAWIGEAARRGVAKAQEEIGARAGAANGLGGKYFGVEKTADYVPRRATVGGDGIGRSEPSPADRAKASLLGVISADKPAVAMAHAEDAARAIDELAGARDEAARMTRQEAMKARVEAFVQEHLPAGSYAIVTVVSAGFPHDITLFPKGLYLKGREPSEATDGMRFSFYEERDAVRWLLAVVESAAIQVRQNIERRQRAVDEAVALHVDLTQRAERLMTERHRAEAHAAG